MMSAGSLNEHRSIWLQSLPHSLAKANNHNRTPGHRDLHSCWCTDTADKHGCADKVLGVQIRAGEEDKRQDSDEMNEIPVVRPDGDVELQDAGKGFRIPPCDSCGGVLKPNVVFFGDGIPKDRAKQ